MNSFELVNNTYERIYKAATDRRDARVSILCPQGSKTEDCIRAWILAILDGLGDTNRLHLMNVNDISQSLKKNYPKVAEELIAQIRLTIESSSSG